MVRRVGAIAPGGVDRSGGGRTREPRLSPHSTAPPRPQIPREFETTAAWGLLSQTTPTPIGTVLPSTDRYSYQFEANLAGDIEESAQEKTKEEYPGKDVVDKGVKSLVHEGSPREMRDRFQLVVDKQLFHVGML